MSSSVMPSDALEDQRLEHGGVEVAVGLGVVGQRGVGDRLVLQRQAEGLLEVAVEVAELDRARRVRSSGGVSSAGVDRG